MQHESAPTLPGAIADADLRSTADPWLQHPDLSQLPPDIDDFTGRQDDLARLRELLQRPHDDGTTAIVISAIAGKAGVGKSALAIRAAHQVRTSYPDGQLYVNLGGPEGHALDPLDVLSGFLRELGVDDSAMPGGLEERARLYRARLARRRVLVVLDNAVSEAQVRPLLPGNVGCAVLITSRSRLAGLDSATTLELDVMEPDQAVDLLARVAGAERVKGEPEAAQEIARLCGYLPLAVRIAGAKLAARSHWSLSTLAERLADERQRLDELTIGDREVRASFALSNQSLSDQERRAFGRLGVLKVPDFALWVVAALLDTESADAEALVERLVEAQLVEVAGEDALGCMRYRLHDLLRVFAYECLQEEPPPARHAALQRVLDGYLSLAQRADALIAPGRLAASNAQTTTTPAVSDPVLIEALSADPILWFTTERASLLIAVEQASASKLWKLTWELAGALAYFFQWRPQWRDWHRTHELALAATRRAGDPLAEASVLVDLGELNRRQGRFDNALQCLHQCLPTLRELGDRRGEAHALLEFGITYHRKGRFDDALDHLNRCLPIFREVGDRRGQAEALKALSGVHREQGQLTTALACVQQSIPIYQELADRRGEADATHGLGIIYRDQRRFQDALACLDRCRAMFAKLGDHRRAAFTLISLSELHRRQGHLSIALQCLDRCLPIFRELADRRGEAYTLVALGDIYRVQGRFNDAASCFDEALPILREYSDRRWEAKALQGLGATLLSSGDASKAQAALLGALTIFRRLGVPEATEVERLIGPQGDAAKQPAEPTRGNDHGTDG